MPKQVPHDEFFAAVGRANSAWGLIESSMFDLFHRLVVCAVRGDGMLKAPDITAPMLGGVFAATSNHDARVKMISSGFFHAVTAPALQEEWRSVEAALKKLYRRRNVIAHGVVWGNVEGASSLAAPMFASGRLKRLDLKGLKDCFDEFSQMSNRIDALAIAVNKHLAP